MAPFGYFGTFMLRPRPELVVPWISGIVLALPLAFVTFPPMADLPLHEVTVSLMRHQGNPTFWGTPDYQWNLGHPNQLFHWLSAILSFAIGVKAACTLVVMASIVMIPVATGELAAHLGRSRWAAALAAPLGLGWLFWWGFVANLLALPLFLYSLRAQDRLVHAPSRKNIAITSAWMILLYAAHEAMLMAACGAMLVLVVVKRAPWKSSLRAVIPLGVAFTMALAQVVFQAKYQATEANHGKAEMIGADHKVSGLTGVLFSGFEPFVRNALFGLCLLAVVHFSWLRWKARARATPRERIFHLRFEIIAFVLLGAYFAMPFNFNGASMVYHRFLPPAWAVLAASCAPPDAALPRLPKLTALVAPVGSLLISWPNLVESSKMYGDAVRLLPLFEAGSTINTIDLGPDKRMFASLTFGAHFVAMKGGRNLFDFTQSTISPVILKRECLWPDVWERTKFGSNLIRPAHDFKLTRYTLIHATEPGFLDAATLILAPFAKAIGRSGEWILFESHSYESGLCAKEIPMSPDPPRPRTVRGLMGELLRQAAAYRKDAIAHPPPKAADDPAP